MMNIQEILSDKYNLNVQKIKKLNGYVSTNFEIVSFGKKFILKVYDNKKVIAGLVKAENEILEIFTGNHKFPQIIKNYKNQKLTFFHKKIYRLLSFVEGNFLAESEHTAQLFERFGSFLAEMDLQMSSKYNSVIATRKFEWDLQYFQEFVPQKIKYISNPSDKKIIEFFILQHQINVVPKIPELRKQIIHNDANDWNVLTGNQQITGIIDFGDVCHSQLINELVIGITYAILNKKEPVKSAAAIVGGYNKIIQLTPTETDSIYWLIAARLCTSVCNSAHEKKLQPYNEYLLISEKPAWNLLKKWITINPVLVQNEFRKAATIPIRKVKSTDEVLTQRFSTVSRVFSVSYKCPVYLESAAFQYMFDKYGNTFLDAYNNIPHVGHSHPRVVEAGLKQMARLNTNTRYLYDQLNEYTGNLLKLFPEKLNTVFLVNSGSAASDLAIRIARTFTQKKKIAALEHGYHGNTASVIDISHYKFAGKGGAGETENVVVLPLPGVFHQNIHEENDPNFIELSQKKIKSSTGDITAFIAEPIVGCGGQIPLPQSYIQNICQQIREQGGIYISDEVQTGFGRLGHHFWGYEMYDVVPDMVILGKPMGNGHPMGAVVTTKEIAQAFNNGMEFFSSFGGNPVSCAIGQAVLDVLNEEELQKNAKIVGDYYLFELKKLQQKHEVIGDIRGSGLFIGFDFVKNKKTLEPDTKLAQHVKNELRNHFVLVSTDGPFNNVIKSKPPLCFTKNNIDEVIEKIEMILNAFGK